MKSQLAFALAQGIPAAAWARDNRDYQADGGRVVE